MVDASAIVALFDSHDSFHDQAVAFRETFIHPYKFELFTTNYIHSEVMTQLVHLPRNVLESLDSLFGSPADRDASGFTQLWVLRETVQAAMPVYFSYLEHGFSVTDCTTLVLMQEGGFPGVFTFDDHFGLYQYQIGHELRKRGFLQLPRRQEEYRKIYLEGIG